MNSCVSGSKVALVRSPFVFEPCANSVIEMHPEKKIIKNLFKLIKLNLQHKVKV
jgi:hypothetical protein